MIKQLAAVLLCAAVLPAAPNVVIILVDDLGYADLSSYGSSINQTPAIDSLARDGIKLPNAYATYLCTPTRAALLTGAHPWRVGLNTVLGVGSTTGLNPSETTIPEYLRGLGYTTALIGKWHLGEEKTAGDDRYRLMPNNHGFDLFAGVPYPNIRTPLPIYLNTSIIKDDVAGQEQQGLTGFFTWHATQFMETAVTAQKPFFLLLSHTQVHAPFYPHPVFLAGASSPYNAMLREIDASTGTVLAKLDALGVRDNTLVVFMSDNGGTAAGYNTPFRGVKGQAVTEGSVRIPMLARWPGVIPAGVSNPSQVTVMDWLPTIVAAAGGTLSAARIDGDNILPVLTNVDYLQRPIYSFGKFALRSVRLGRFKLDIRANRVYNLFVDPGETRNVAAVHPDATVNLKRLVADMDNDLGTTWPCVKPGCRPVGQ